MAKQKWQKAEQGLAEVGEREYIHVKGHKGTFGRGETEMFYDLTVAVTSLYICQNSLNCVKNCEGFEILSYLQANKLACQCAGHQQKTWGSWVRNKGLYYSYQEQ